MLSPRGPQQRIVERAPKRLAVGETRQGVLPSETVEFDLGLADFRQVRRKAAIAEKTANLVVNRAAGDGPPDFVLGLGPDDEVLKRDVGRQIEAQSPFRS